MSKGKLCGRYPDTRPRPSCESMFDPHPSFHLKVATDLGSGVRSWTTLSWRTQCEFVGLKKGSARNH